MRSLYSLGLFLLGLTAVGAAVVRPPIFAVVDYAPPEVTGAVLPVLPRVLREAEELDFDVLLNAEGQVLNVARAVAMDPSMEQAVKAVLVHWKFSPARHAGEPVPAVLRLRIDDYFYFRDAVGAETQLPYSRALLNARELQMMAYLIDSLGAGELQDLEFLVEAGGRVSNARSQSAAGKRLIERVFKANPDTFRFVAAREADAAIAVRLGWRLSVLDPRPTGTDGVTERLPLPRSGLAFGEDAGGLLPVVMKLRKNGTIEAAWVGADVPDRVALGVLNAMRRWRLAEVGEPTVIGYFAEATLVVQPDGADGTFIDFAMKPRLVDYRPPELVYARAIRANPIRSAGSTVASWNVDSKGAVSDLKFEVDIGQEEVLVIISNSIKSSRYRPAEWNGIPVQTRLRREYTF